MHGRLVDQAFWGGEGEAQQEEDGVDDAVRGVLRAFGEVVGGGVGEVQEACGGEAAEGDEFGVGFVGGMGGAGAGGGGVGEDLGEDVGVEAEAGAEEGDLGGGGPGLRVAGSEDVELGVERADEGEGGGEEAGG